MSISIQYVWLAGSLGFFIIWLVVFFLAERESKKEMFIISLVTSLFGVFAQFFIRKYWDPPISFSLIHKADLNIENIIFAFSMGGVAFVTYKAIFKRWQRGKIIRILTGGVIFTGICFIFFASFNWAFPGYSERAWSFQIFSGMKIFGVPTKGLFFFFVSGMLLTVFYKFLGVGGKNLKLEKEGEEPYRCSKCGLFYKEKEWSEKCEAWCKEHNSCNLEIIEHAISKTF